MSDHPKPLPSNKVEREIVLPSGVFAKIRRINWIDLALANIGEPALLQLRLAQRVVTFDGEVWPLEKIMSLDVDDAIPVSELINAQILTAKKFEGGIG